MNGILEVNRALEGRHLLAASYLNCMALGLCFLMPWTPDFTGYQLPIGIMGFDTVSEFKGDETDKVVDMAVAIPSMLVYLFPLFLAVNAVLATLMVKSGLTGAGIEKAFALSAVLSGLFPIGCLITVIAFFGHKGFYGDLGLYFAVFVGLAMIWQLTGIGGKGAEAP
jgi:hypothetical protein